MANLKKRNVENSSAQKPQRHESAFQVYIFEPLLTKDLCLQVWDRSHISFLFFLVLRNSLRTEEKVCIPERRHE